MHTRSRPRRGGRLPAALPLASAALALLLAGGSAAPAATPREDRTGADRAVAPLGADLPSHAELFRARVVEVDTRAGPDGAQRWTVEVRTASGSPVERARLRVRAWMPETGEHARREPRVAAELGGGRYRVEGLRFPRAGWWNVPVEIAAEAGTDSLAFNLVVAGAPPREAR